MVDGVIKERLKIRDETRSDEEFVLVLHRLYQLPSLSQFTEDGMFRNFAVKLHTRKLEAGQSRTVILFPNADSSKILCLS